jgi:predicted phage terminase large subunit-like protein
MGLFREGAVEARDSESLTNREINERFARCPEKLLRFWQAGYRPHHHQSLVHTCYERIRVAGAGRRGGKTEGVAYEFADLCNPAPIKVQAADGTTIETTVQRSELVKYGVRLPRPDRPIINIIFTPDTKNYPATKRKFDEALDALGIPYEYNENKQTWFIPSKRDQRCIVYWRGTDKPRSARGEGYCAAWGDEPAFIVSSDYIDALEPALSDHRGIWLFSTTPSQDVDNWWFYDYYIQPEKVDGKWVGRKGIAYFEWTSLENPYFDKEEYEEKRARRHPLLFAREYMARWEKGGGQLLKLSWLHYYDPAKDMHQKEDGTGVDWSRYQLFAGVDPASSLRTSADYFVCWVIAWERETGQGYLVDMYRDKIEFPEQIAYLRRLREKWPGLLRIGVETVAYQSVLLQQGRAAGITGLVEVRPGRMRKEDRIMQLGPTFKNRQLLIRNDMTVFMEEWEQFPNGKHDDTLDAVDIAIQATGSLLPGLVHSTHRPQSEADPLLDRHDPGTLDQDFYDEEMGCDW